MSNYRMFERIEHLVGDAARSAQLNIGAAIQRLLTSKVPALQSEDKAPAPQSEASLRSEDNYFSLIAGAVSKLPHNTHVARQALYDRMWVAIAAQLLSEQDPPASEVAGEQLAFQKAICKIEVEMAMYKVEGYAPGKE